MSKELSEMTREELWELFPIFLVEHREKWHDDYREIEAELQKLLSQHSVSRISHIGSTVITDFVRRFTKEARKKYGGRYC